jgi:type IV secretion system protein VirD4
VSLIAAPFAILAILYAGGFLAQLLGNYATWKQGGGIPGDGTSPLAASPDFLLCLSSVLRPPYGVYGILICIGLLAVLLIMVMRMGYGDAGDEVAAEARHAIGFIDTGLAQCDSQLHAL